MLYVILEKDLSTDLVSVYDVYEDQDLAEDTLVELINENEGFAYMITEHVDQ